jgi:hypothetical protein
VQLDSLPHLLSFYAFGEPDDGLLSLKPILILERQVSDAVTQRDAVCSALLTKRCSGKRCLQFNASDARRLDDFNDIGESL